MNELGVEWLSNNVIKYKSKIYMVVLLFMLPAFSLFFAFNVEFDLKQAGYDFATVYIFLAFVFRYLMHYLMKLKIGVYGDKVHIYVRGEKLVADFDELQLCIGYVFSRNAVVPVGSGYFLLFDRDKLQKRLLSNINNHKNFSGDKANRRLWGVKEPIFVSTLVVVLVLFVLW